MLATAIVSSALFFAPPADAPAAPPAKAQPETMQVAPMEAPRSDRVRAGDRRVLPRAAHRAQQHRSIPDPFRGQSRGFSGQYNRNAVFGDPFASSAARHRPNEPDPVHAQFNDTPQRWPWVRRAWVAPAWGYGYGGYGLGWGAGYGVYPGYGWSPGWRYPGAGVWAGAAGFGLGIGLGALIW